MSKTIRTEEAKELHKHAIEFERKLIADWLRYMVTPEIQTLIQNGDYRHYFAHGTLPNKDGEFFQPFESEVPHKKTCEICKSENLKDGIDWFDEGDQITRTQWECLDCGWKWDEPPFPGVEEDEA